MDGCLHLRCKGHGVLEPTCHPTRAFFHRKRGKTHVLQECGEHQHPGEREDDPGQRGERHQLTVGGRGGSPPRRKGRRRRARRRIVGKRAPFTYVWAPWYLSSCSLGILGDNLPINTLYILLFRDFPWRGPTLGPNTNSRKPINWTLKKMMGMMEFRNGPGFNYCWWFRNPANQLRLVVYPIIYRVFDIPGGCLGFLPSTVCLRIFQHTPKGTYPGRVRTPTLHDSEFLNHLGMKRGCLGYGKQGYVRVLLDYQDILVSSRSFSRGQKSCWIPSVWAPTNSDDRVPGKHSVPVYHFFRTRWWKLTATCFPGLLIEEKSSCIFQIRRYWCSMFNALAKFPPPFPWRSPHGKSTEFLHECCFSLWQVWRSFRVLFLSLKQLDSTNSEIRNSKNDV